MSKWMSSHEKNRTFNYMVNFLNAVLQAFNLKSVHSKIADCPRNKIVTFLWPNCGCEETAKEEEGEKTFLVKMLRNGENNNNPKKKSREMRQHTDFFGVR